MIVKPSESPEKESVNTSATKRMTRLLSGKPFHKDLHIWCMEPDESIKKKRKLDKILFITSNKRSHGHIFVQAHLS